MTRVGLVSLAALLACARAHEDLQPPLALDPEVTATEGGTATLRCLFDGNPLPNITWRFHTSTIDGDAGRYRLMPDGALEINPLHRSDAGDYICVADNGIGMAMQQIHLAINDLIQPQNCSQFREECEELYGSCLYGIHMSTQDGCERRCKCIEDPCVQANCSSNMHCELVELSKPAPQGDLYAAKCVAGGGDCDSSIQDCNKVKHCYFGVEKITDAGGCKRCKCKQNPCKKISCAAGERCVVLKSIPSNGQEPLFSAECGAMVKAGACPKEKTSPLLETCFKECKDDASCRGTGKCCQRGCSQLCLEPIEQASTRPPSPTTAPDDTPLVELTTLPEPVPQVVLASEGGRATLRCQFNANSSSKITWKFRKHTNKTVQQHRTRHRRHDSGLYLPASYVIPGGEGEGPWGEWEKVSPCSRTCGGGVASQKRICLQSGSEGQPLCTGGDTKYFSCQTQDCPVGSGDFRAEQCAEFNDKAFRGFKYNWVPYTKASNPCELNCMPHGERFYFRHKLQVTDGTKCNDESFDVCVNGKCQPVGCDMMLNSTARMDKCRVCRGNGTDCRTTTGIIDSQNLIKGYNDILLIPSGTTSINIEEIQPSYNYLSLRAKNGTYYLNGHYHIDFPRTIMVAGAFWIYERSQLGFAAPDKLRCLGPTTEPLYLSLLLQDQNVGFRYEYSVPDNSAPPTDKRYNWVHEEFTPCSATCGGGFQTRNVACRSTEELEIVDDILCDVGVKPPTNQSCSLDPCPAQWVKGAWGKCFKRGNAEEVKAREVTCHKIIASGVKSIVPDKECIDLLGPKPEVIQECAKDSRGPTWLVGHWRPCDKLCNKGKQTRKVVCYQTANSGIEVLDDENCAEEKPDEEQSCILRPCGGDDWVTFRWSTIDGNTGRYRLKSDGALEIVALERNDTGVYICMADNSHGMATQEIQLVVNDPERMPAGIAEDDNAGVIAELDNLVHLRCLAYGHPPPSVFWYYGHDADMVLCNDTMYEVRGNVLDIKSLSIDSLGPYTCRANNGEGKVASWVIIVRAYKPEGLFIHNEYLVPRDTLASRSRPQPPNPSEMTTSTVTTTETLFSDTSTNSIQISECSTTNVETTGVNSTSTADPYSGFEFSCCADNETEASRPMGQGCPCNATEFGYCLDRVPPDPERTPAGIVGDDNVGVIGELDNPVYLCCLAYGYPPLSVSWYYGKVEDMVKSNDTVYEVRGNVIHIKSLSIDSLGPYTCRANNGKDKVASWVINVRAYMPEGLFIHNEYLVPRDALASKCRPQTINPTEITTVTPTETPFTETLTTDELAETTTVTAESIESSESSTTNEATSDVPSTSTVDPSSWGCQYALHGCCPDNATIAQGPDNQGCGCQYTQHGCCLDRHTVASGPNNEGCACSTYQFGCCADGVTIAQGPDQQGCHCRDSKFGCCGDGETYATGPDAAGCNCSSSQYGCCPDGLTEAAGRKFLGCTDAPENKQAACSISTDPGSCINFTAMWYYNMTYGGCSRFWYGGCDGNGNRFATKKDCEDVCVQPSPKDACKLPRVKGICDADYQHWYYNSTREQCIPFRYGGCLGNANNFDTRELCQKQCEPNSVEGQCNLSIDRGSCAGNYSRWGFKSAAHRCEQFTWGGCEGNSNRFSSEVACQMRCAGVQLHSVQMAVEIIVNENTEVIGELGSPLKVRCQPHGDPPLYMSWYHDVSKLLYNDSVYELKGSVLLIRSLSIDTLGQYSCQANYGEGKAVTRSVVVQAYKSKGPFNKDNLLVPLKSTTQPPVTALITTEVPRSVFTVPVSTHVSALFSTLNIGADLHLMCEVDGFPEPDVHWTKDGAVLQTDDRIAITGSAVVYRLTLKRVSVADSGLYACHASNPYSSQSDTAQINIRQLVVPTKCTDNPFFANCDLIVQSKYCTHEYYSKFCCKTCVEAGQLTKEDVELQQTSPR